MSKTLNRIVTAVGFVMLFAMFAASYGISSGKVTAMMNGGASSAVATTKAPNNG